MTKNRIILVLTALLAFGGLAWAQNAGQAVQTLVSSDLIQIYRGGTAANVYTSAGDLRDGRFYALALAANSDIAYVYDLAANTWYRFQ